MSLIFMFPPPNFSTFLTTLLVIHLSSNSSSSIPPWQEEPLPRIIGGDECFVEDHPFIVSISHLQSPKSSCAGTLVQPKWVLTAAHCFPNNIQEQWVLYEIQAGSSRRKKNEGEEPQVVYVSEAYFHDDSKPPLHLNDIVLIHLEDALKLNNFVALAKLPQPPSSPAKFCNTTLSMGWGGVVSVTASERHKSVSSEWLRCLELKMVSVSVCGAYWSDQVIENKILCVKFDERNKGNCYGDSGGPIVCTDKPDTVIGIVSKGDGCGQGTPAVYTRVDAYLDWIDETIRNGSEQVLVLSPLFFLTVIINYIVQ